MNDESEEVGEDNNNTNVANDEPNIVQVNKGPSIRI